MNSYNNDNSFDIVSKVNINKIMHRKLCIIK